MNNNDCRDVESLLGPYLDSELDTETSLEIALHLKECPACAARFAGEADWQRRLHAALNAVEPTEGLWEPIEERVRELSRPPQGAREPGGLGEPPARHPTRPTASQGWRYWLWPSPRLYAGLAATWAVILGIQIGTREPGPARVPSTAVTRTALAEQRHLLAELLGANVPEPERVGTPPPQTGIQRTDSDPRVPESAAARTTDLRWGADGHVRGKSQRSILWEAPFVGRPSSIRCGWLCGQSRAPENTIPAARRPADAPPRNLPT